MGEKKICKSFLFKEYIGGPGLGDGEAAEDGVRPASIQNYGIYEDNLYPQSSLTLYIHIILAKCSINYPISFKISGKDLRNYLTIKFKGLIFFMLPLNGVSELE